MGALEAPQDRHGQEHRTRTSRAEQTTELGALEAMVELGAQAAMAELGAQAAMAGGPLQPEPFYPQKNFPGVVRGYQEPSGAGQTRTYKTGQESPPGLNRQTGQPTGTRSPPGLARRLRLLLGMTRSQGPSQGPSATASTSTTQQEEPPAPDESPWTRQD